MADGLGFLSRHSTWGSEPSASQSSAQGPPSHLTPTILLLSPFFSLQVGCSLVEPPFSLSAESCLERGPDGAE